MKDAEFIYSLYVQANPVLDPDLLPLTRDEAVLLTLERSPDMITQEQDEKLQPQTPPRRKRLLPALAAAAVLIAAVAATAVLVSRDSGPVAAADANPVVEFDGTACSYEGPTLIEEGVVDFSMTNTAERDFFLQGFRMEEATLSQELAAWPVGTDIETTPDTPMPKGVSWFSWWLQPGESQTSAWLLEPGSYLAHCVVGNPGEHVWRTALIEVVASG